MAKDGKNRIKEFETQQREHTRRIKTLERQVDELLGKCTLLLIEIRTARRKPVKKRGHENEEQV